MTDATTLTFSPAGATESNVAYLARRRGADGNRVRMYGLDSSSRLQVEPDTVQFAGGSSDVKWRISIDFDALGLTDIRQAWLTLAPKLSDGQAYSRTEWSATITNWAIGGVAHAAEGSRLSTR